MQRLYVENQKSVEEVKLEYFCLSIFLQAHFFQRGISNIWATFLLSQNSKVLFPKCYLLVSMCFSLSQSFLLPYDPHFLLRICATWQQLSTGWSRSRAPPIKDSSKALRAFYVRFLHIRRASDPYSRAQLFDPTNFTSNGLIMEGICRLNTEYLIQKKIFHDVSNTYSP